MSRPCKCGAPSFNLAGNYCVRHHRFKQMRGAAKRHGKAVPTVEWLEANVPEGMVCPCCSRQMNWLQNEGASTCLTLQHDREGSMRLICQACNTRHSKLPGDSYYVLPEGHWRCGKCKEIKQLGEFYFSNGKITWCRCCSIADVKARRAADPGYRERRKLFRKANREKVNAAKRAWKAANREKVAAQKRAYREANPERVKALESARREANREATRARQRAAYARSKLQ